MPRRTKAPARIRKQKRCLTCGVQMPRAGNEWAPDCGEACYRQRLYADAARRNDPARYRELADRLVDSVEASPDDLMIIKAALYRATDYDRINALVWKAIDAYTEDGSKREIDRLKAAGRIIMGKRPPWPEILARHYDAMIGAAEMDRETQELCAGLTWARLLSARPQRRTRRPRESAALGADLTLRPGVNADDFLALPLSPLEAVAALMVIYHLPSMEAVAQHLKRARRRGKVRGTVPGPRRQ